MTMIRSARRFGIVTALVVITSVGVHTPAFADGLTKIADGVYSYVDEKNPSPATSFGAKGSLARTIARRPCCRLLAATVT